jgi:hypothetical protein
MSGHFLKMHDKQTTRLELNLPEPRIWDAKRLAEFLGVSVHWVFKRTQSSAEDPIPRVPGIGRLKFDTENPRFQNWMRRQLGLVDLEGEYE